MADVEQAASVRKRMVKRNPDGGAPKSIADVYGNAWLTAGCGSVILLTGDPGDPIIGFRHARPPVEEVGPWRLLHDNAAGELTVQFAVDLVELVKSGGADRLTAREAAAAMFHHDDDKPPTRADIEKARRKLDVLTDRDGVLYRHEGIKGGGKDRAPTVWFLAAHGVHGQSRTGTKPQVSAITLDSPPPSITETITGEHGSPEIAGQTITGPAASNHANLADPPIPFPPASIEAEGETGIEGGEAPDPDDPWATPEPQPDPNKVVHFRDPLPETIKPRRGDPMAGWPPVARAIKAVEPPQSVEPLDDSDDEGPVF